MLGIHCYVYSEMAQIEAVRNQMSKEVTELKKQKVRINTISQLRVQLVIGVGYSNLILS